MLNLAIHAANEPSDVDIELFDALLAALRRAEAKANAKLRDAGESGVEQH